MSGPDTTILKTNATLWAIRTLSLVLLFTGLPLFVIGWIAIEMNTANPPSNLWFAMAFIGGGMTAGGALLGLVLACVMFRIMSRNTH